jgi:hypothetical protein
MRKTRPRSFRLEDAVRDQCLIRLSRRFEDSSIRGYVLEVGPSFFLFTVVSDRVHFDGFECFRVKDLKGIKPDPYTTFVESALKKRRECRPRKPSVNVASIEELLLSASRAFPLVAIHTEVKDPDVCWIGRILGVNRGRVSLLEINPDAAWDNRPTEHRLNDITRVNFGGEYEDALHLVGGAPKSR